MAVRQVAVVAPEDLPQEFMYVVIEFDGRFRASWGLFRTAKLAGVWADQLAASWKCAAIAEGRDPDRCPAYGVFNTFIAEGIIGEWAEQGLVADRTTVRL